MKSLGYRLWLVWLVVPLVGCPSGGPPPSFDSGIDAYQDADTQTGGDAEKEVEDVGDAIDTADGEVGGPETEVVAPNPPQLSLYFDTATGPKGKDSDQVTLTPEDEPADYKDTPGYQVDVVVETKNLENGRDVRLYVLGNVVEVRKVQVDPATGGGFVLFDNVTLPSSKQAYEVKAVATNQAGLKGEVTKQVAVEIGSCGVTVLPTNEQCLITDADPETPQVEASISVSNPDRTCDKAVLEYSIGGNSYTLGPLDLDANGTVTFTFIVAQSAAEADGIQVQVQAKVMDSTAPERTGVSPALTYVVDMVDPVLTLSKPDKDKYGLVDDKDGDPSNGLQMDVAGTVSGHAPGSKVTVKLNGQEVGQTIPDQKGKFLYEDLTMDKDGGYTVTASAVDECGREGSAQKDFTVKLSKAVYDILSPKNGEVLLARDDQDQTTPKVYETAIKVQAESVEQGVVLTARCRTDAPSTAFVEVGTLTIQSPDAGVYEVPVAIDAGLLGQHVRCMVADDAENPATSQEVQFTIAIPPPMLKVLAPTANQVVVQHELQVLLLSQGLEGVVPTVAVRDKTGQSIIDFVPPAPIHLNGLAFNLPLEVGGIPVSDGVYKLSVDAQDQYGNKASENAESLVEVPFELDTTAPSVTIVVPDHTTLDPVANQADQDADPGAPGYQVDFQLELDQPAPGGKACLSVDTGGEVCNALQGEEATTTIHAVTLQPGSNHVTAWVVDAAGNEGAKFEEDFEVNLDAPRVVISEPAHDGPIAIIPFDMVVGVSDPQGNPLADAQVTIIRQNGQELGPKQTNSEGMASIVVPELSEQGEQFVAKATKEGKYGYSAPRHLYLKTTVPALEFVVPHGGDVINLSYAACSPGQVDCVLDVTLEAVNLEDGAKGTLAWSCGEVSNQAVSGVKGGELTFKGISLKHGETCTLQAEAVDLSAQHAQAGPISVVVDRVAPTVEIVEPTAQTNVLLQYDDEDPSTPGLQYKVRVMVGGVEAGAAVKLTFRKVGEQPQSVIAQVPQDVPEGATLHVIMPQVTLPDGPVQLIASVSDSAGNEASTQRLVTVLSQEPTVGIIAPDYIPNQPCEQSAECPAGGMCASGTCRTAWGKSSVRSLRLKPLGVPYSENNLRLCSDGVSPGPDNPPCSTLGFAQVAVGTTSPVAGVSVDLYPTGLPDGFHTLIAEAKVADGVPWVSSVDNPEESFRRRYVYQDLKVPEITGITSPSDTELPQGILNIAEQKAPGRVFDIQFEVSEPGSAQVFVNGVSQVSVPAHAGSGLVDVTLAEGPNEIYVVAADLVGNQSVMPPDPNVLYYSPTVDTVPPKVEFLTPPVVTANHSRDLAIQSDAVGQTLTIFDGNTQVAQAVVPESQVVEFPFSQYPVLTDGVHSLKAVVKDAAGNPGEATLDVTVDTEPPQVVLFEPADGAVLHDADDADPSQAGFQVGVKFATGSSDAQSWNLSVWKNCDENYGNCEGPLPLSSGVVTNPGGLEPQQTVTLTSLGTTPYYVFELAVLDQVGNQTKVQAKVQIDLQTCTVVINGLPSGGLVNNQSCPQPGLDCDTAQVQVEVNVSASCGAVDRVRLEVGEDVKEKQFQSNPSTFDVQFQHGAKLTLQATAFVGLTAVGTSGQMEVSADLHDPVVQFTTPATGSQVGFGVKDDELPGAAGLQKTLVLHAEDENLVGGAIVTLTLVTGGGGQTGLSPEAPQLPYVFQQSAEDVSLVRVTLPDQIEGTVMVSVKDAFGNDAQTQFGVNVDLQPPAAVTLQQPLGPNDVDPRLPAVTLHFSAVGDDGDEAGSKAAAYQVRYSRTPIDNADDFEAACDASDLEYGLPMPEPALQGENMSYTVTGPDMRSGDDPCVFRTGIGVTYYFAVRAVDEVGNVSPITPDSVVSAETSFRFALITGQGDWYNPDFQRRVYGVGDLNGDGLSEVALGGGALSGFCLIYGHADAAGQVGDYTVNNDTGQYHQCFRGDAGSLLGTLVMNLGDVNGDGIDDLGVGEGNAKTGPPRKLLVYFGKTGGISQSPNLVIQGMAPATPFIKAAGGGDFDGDGVADIAIGSAAQNTAFLLPGDTSWDASTSLTIDLSSEADRTNHRVVTFTMEGASDGTYFGDNVAFVKDVDQDGKDEVAISVRADQNPSAVLVIRGRQYQGALSIVVSKDNSGLPEDQNTTRLKPDAAAKRGFFGSTAMDGMSDLDGDGRGDVLIGHFYELTAGASSTMKTVYGFYGSAIADKFGGDLHVNAGPTPCPEGSTYHSDTGFVVCGQYRTPVVLGNVDGVSAYTSSTDIAYVLYSTTQQYGRVFVRLNLEDKAGAIAQGTFPYASPILVDPTDPGSLAFGYLSAVPTKDFNGDGRPDILVGTNNSGYAVLLY